MADVLRHATFEAYERVIDLCVDRRVDALLVAGDVFDGSDRSLAAQVQFVRGLERLHKAGIRAFIQSMGEETERLPVIVDEVLVNFDLERARRAAAAFVDLSRTNQVLVLTCHQWIVDLFKEATPDAALVDLSAVQAAP